jgi:hypothetical protein
MPNFLNVIFPVPRTPSTLLTAMFRVRNLSITLRQFGTLIFGQVNHVVFDDNLLVFAGRWPAIGHLILPFSVYQTARHSATCSSVVCSASSFS